MEVVGNGDSRNAPRWLVSFSVNSTSRAVSSNILVSMRCLFISEHFSAWGECKKWLEAYVCEK